MAAFGLRRRCFKQSDVFSSSGDFGAGKTTLLHHRALFSARKFLNNEPNAKCPFFIPARRLQGPSSYLDAMRHLLMDEYRISIQREQFLTILESGNVELFVDGLDERPTDSSEFSNYLAMLFRQTPRLDGLIATRPSGLPSNLFGFANLIQPLDDEQIRAFIHASFGGDKDKVAEVRQIIAATYDLEDLAKRPLLLGMMIDVFRRYDWVPENPAALFELFIDQSLRRQSAKAITRKPRLSDFERLQILGRLASEIFETGNLALSRDAVIHIINDWLGKRRVETNEILIDLRETSFLSFDTETWTFSFVHVSYVEYFTALHHCSKPEIVPLLRRKPSREVSYFAIGILSDVRPLAEYAVAAEKFDLAARCVWQGRTTNAALTDFVVGHFRRAVGEPFLPILLRNVTLNDTPSETADDKEAQKADQPRRAVATMSEDPSPNQEQSDEQPEHAGPPILDKFEILLDFL